MYRSTDTHVYFLGGYFSQWARTPFTGSVPILRASSSGAILRPAGSLRFNCCEQFMMAGKAMVFNDQDAMLAIMDADHPAEQKKLGRTVKNFDQAIWESVARDIVYIGNYYKFTQHTASREFLDESENRIIVEGADYDPVWGVKIDWADPAIEDESNWKGTNWLGQCIMRVREDIGVHGTNADPWKIRRAW